jgi:hypothetical protein
MERWWVWAERESRPLWAYDDGRPWRMGFPSAHWTASPTVSRSSQRAEDHRSADLLRDGGVVLRGRRQV